MAHDASLPEGQPPALEIESLELFRRSPHPYHRRQTTEVDSEADTDAQPSSSTRDSEFLRTHIQPSIGSTRSDEDGRKRRKISQSPSESGTEADDEGYGYVKLLPAPPLRLHKGLKGGIAGVDGSASPLLTPSIGDEDRRFGESARKGIQRGEPSPTDEETKMARQKYLKRRRNEAVRRITETALLGVIGVLAVSGCGCWEQLLQWHRVELLVHVVVMGALLALYPFRLLLYSWTRTPPSNLYTRKRIRIPAAFDPAPVLYPAVIPVLISISLFANFQRPLLPNILLGLAALPPQLIPYGTSPLGFSTSHWLVSILPLIASERTDIPSSILASIPHKVELPRPQRDLQPELLVLLFPLHQALLPPLHYLTTTSLLPTELHLLSIGLINLLLFAESPQAVILKILLWVGGLGVFVLCGKVLKWGVALARIPRWRFRRAGHTIRARQSFLHILNQRLRSNRSRSAVLESDADEDEPIIKQPSKKKNMKPNCRDSSKENHSSANGEVQSAAETNKPDFEEKKTDSPTRRRNTLPSLRLQPNTVQETPHHRRRAKSIAQSFLALTPTQALVRKYMYAAYFYLIVVVLILGPIRHLIGTQALHSHEPFGWAISYLFGNIQPLRFQVFNYNLNSWIPLPPLLDTSDLSWATSLSPAEYLRRITLGEANTRLLLCLYCLLIIALGLISVFSLSAVAEVDTRRKVFHGTMVAMLLPTIYIDPCFISLALTLVLAIFILLDLIRASQLPPLSAPIARFLAPYVDGRDLRGPVVVSHIFLLIGCAIPLWLSLAGVDRQTDDVDDVWLGWTPRRVDISMISGVVCVGMGDAAASLVGRRWGRRKWAWVGGKSLEGSAAFAAAVAVGLIVGKIWMVVGWQGVERVGFIEGVWEVGMVVLKASVCAIGASLEEAVLTGGNDNVVVPVMLWVLVRGVGL